MKTFLKRVASLLPDRLAQDLRFAQRTGRWPNKRSPKRFTDKIHAYKRCYPSDEAVSLVDKITAKDIVSRILGPDWVIPTVFAGDHLPAPGEIDWPDGFTIKAAHGSGWNYFVKRGTTPNWSEIREKVETWLRERRASYLGETPYYLIEKRILVEPLLGDGHILPVDYKVFVFNGAAKFVQVDTDRENEHKRSLYTTAWKKLDVEFHYPIDLRGVARPASLDQMIGAAEKLAAPYQFARVDFYEVGNKPYFGEVTFFPESGAARFSPDKADFEFGNLWEMHPTPNMAVRSR